ncbi:lysophospholipid acyltransferase family protein [Leptospira stimsonii]|uniref:Acyltransferase n=1 Tax=Leptospira stimsonii TaxID=2202203 RepID=A0A4R9L1T6_9LEPT|nr:1-acyl-sn-glycerol-3-phosphate acyltransferase [Leptospira stimsonii]RHX86849.1 acyltransferase [Leptospira stimsonii]TGK14616.1 1-acyl-sn-glycerol-3-phosphate acyltransferase [Leptospira stimsonii]TGM10039.1 1-acyl-sn-glycerol-3-phosphate acyltransferase [Leptospira stimsonii]
MNPLKFMESRLGRFPKSYRRIVLKTYLITLPLVFSLAFPSLIAGLFFAIIRNQEKKNLAFLRGSATWGGAVQWMTGTKFLKLGEINIPQKGYMVFINHVNELDFPYDCLVVNKPFLANQVIKKTLIAYWWMKAMGSQVFESSKATTIAVSVRNLIKGLHKTSFIVYPEGHNSYTEEIQPMQKGMIKLAFENKIPVVVVLKSGITGYQTKESGFVVAYKQIGSYDPTKFGTWEEFRDFLFETMSKEKKNLDASLYTGAQKESVLAS